MWTRRILACSLLAAATLGLLIPAEIFAQSSEQVTIQGMVVDVTKPGGQDLPIAIPRPQGTDEATAELWEILRRDLEISGYFRVIDPQAFIEGSSAGLRPGEFQFTDWDVPAAVALAKTAIAPANGGLRAEVWVYDVPGRRKLGAKAFSAGASQLRTLGHRIANEIILQITGEPGIFNTRFAAVTKATGNKEIALVDVDGARVRRLTQNGSINLEPAWSPDGRSLAYTSYRTGNPDLFVFDLERGQSYRRSARPGINTGAAYHPLGQILALTLSLGGNTDLYAIDPNTGAKFARLTQSPGIDVSPTFSPDGSQVAFASERSGGVQIYAMPSQGGSAQRVTFQGSHNTDPAWSPRGGRIAYVSRDGVFDLFTTGVDGTGTLRLTQHQGDNEDPDWSPNGRYISFSSSRTGSPQIWITSADGTHQVQITQGGGGYTNPAWSPVLTW